MKSNRRDFLKITSTAAVSVPFLTSLYGFTEKTSVPQTVKTPKQETKTLLSLNVSDYGVTGDGMADDTKAIQQTIDRCHVLGGGEVLFPAGNYLTGSIQLRSNITLVLEKDAVLTGTPAFSDYPVMQVRWEGKWIQGHTGLIYAVDAENIGIRGAGKIAGNHTLGGRPNKENPLRHPALIEFLNCKNITLQDFSTDYYLMWCIHPVYCENITIRNLTIRSTGGNGDGIDVDSCKHVLIETCDIATGDDCIAIKSGRGMEGYTLLKTTEDVRIRNCRFSDSNFACIGIGSETSGGIRNVLIEHCTFTDTKTHAIYIKSRVGRGAFVEDITARDLVIDGMQGGFLRINHIGSGIQDQDPVPGDEGIPLFKNFRISDVKVNNTGTLVDAAAVHPQKMLDGLVLENITGNCRKGISLANIKNARLSHIDVTGYSGPLLTISNVRGKGLDGAVKPDTPSKEPETIVKPEKQYQLK